MAIDWRAATTDRCFIPTERIIASQVSTQALDAHKVMLNYMAMRQPGHDGMPRQCGVYTSDSHEAFSTHPNLGELLAKVPKRTAAFEYTYGQRMVVAWLAFGHTMDLPPMEARVVYDARALRTCKAKPGDADLVEARVTASLSGVVAVDTLTGSGKTAMSLCAGILRLADDASWRSLRHSHTQCRHSACTYGRNGLSFVNDTSQTNTLARLLLVRTSHKTPIIQIQFQEQLANLWPDLQTQLDPSIVLEVWASHVEDKLRNAATQSGGRLVIRTHAARSVQDAAHQPPHKVIMWFLTTDSKDNGALLDRKRSLDDMLAGGTRSATVPLEIVDELMSASSKQLPGQEAPVLQRWIVQATPAALRKGGYAKTHWLRGVLSPSLGGLVAGCHLTSADMHAAVEALVRLTVMSLPRQLKAQVASDVADLLPRGLEVWPVHIRGGFNPRGEQGDALTRVPLADFVARCITPEMRHACPTVAGRLAAVVEDASTARLVPLLREVLAVCSEVAALGDDFDMAMRLIQECRVICITAESTVAQASSPGQAELIAKLCQECDPVLMQPLLAEIHLLGQTPTHLQSAAQKCMGLPDLIRRVASALAHADTPRGVVDALQAVPRCPPYDMPAMRARLEQLRDACALALGDLSAADRRQIPRQLPALQRCLRQLDNDKECVVCLEPCATNLMPCCTTLICTECATRVRQTQPRCPACRHRMSDIVGIDLAPVTDQPLTLQELSERTDGRRDAMTTLRQVLAAIHPSPRVLLYCTHTSDLGDRLQDMHHSPRQPDALPLVSVLTGKTVDRAVSQAYRDCDSHPDPMILLCTNAMLSSEVSGLDLGCTTALIVVGELSNPSQLVARVLRPGPPGQAQRTVPFILIK